tara:strand:+ start:715 stop:909 length:195 start_codon:yes stop_codon:yes gene_type:complete
MPTYECNICGMSVNATCGKCNETLVNDYLSTNDGSEVQISRCPNDHGKIKSPTCCGADMSCSTN